MARGRDICNTLKAIRKQIADKCQMFKQTPIEDVRKVLIKKGFIKNHKNHYKTT